MSSFDEMDAFEGASLSARAMAARPQPYLDGLNPAQRAAVEQMDGPVLMLAGAGTGKTKALTARIVHLMNTGRARPNEILAVTFTNKAAREMKTRVGHMLGQQVEGMPWLGTFHAICVKLLRRHAELVGLKSNFTILDTDDQLRLLKQLIRAEGIDDKRWPARMLAGIIDGWKNRALTPDKVPAADAGLYNHRGTEVYDQYQRRLKELNAVDFGDLLLHMVTIFQTHPDILEQYQRWFKYILVDEYQDTNVAQYLWLRLLAQGHRNICCVGDDDQSIYGWRGAEVGNILRFETDFPGAHVVKLEQNYRSTPHILAAASGVIAGNEGRLGKTLWTEAEDGEKVRLIGHWDGEEEARWIGDEIEAMQRGTRGQDAISLDHMAILVRASHQMRAFEDRFLTIGLPYRVIGGPRFYERLEIRDAMAYFRVVTSPDDDLAFERIVNTPKRGLGDKAQQKIQITAREHGTNLVEGARILLAHDGLGGKGGAQLRLLIDGIDRWGRMVGDDAMSHVELAEIILDESGYTGMWQNDKTPEAPGRLENLKELVKALEQFENLQGFLEHVSLIMDNESDDGGAKVSIMTLHAAKGLEFPAVFLPGWEDGLFPSQRSMDESGIKGLEEERRLAYVGITRAEELCTISFAANRRVFGQWQSSMPSRFIDELPEENVEVLTPPGLYGGGFGAAMPTSNLHDQAAEANVYNSPGWRRLQARAGERGMSQPKETRNVTIDMNAVSSFTMGERVFHQKFGYGAVIGIEGDKLEVEFEKAGTKKVVSRFLSGCDDVPF
ncbi:UvrD-helicase domain-containing protein [Sulfitobacter mediterraneus]|uniref:ATP-dependent helicase n=1 Tax=Sulfitobacter mediterraneus TaxID=83219 RepID=UPI001939C349|nr:UvrD-helicase domain-containing protein [Sulfitobacter mediterraneus]MBM1557392.1 UvrD-helicase domain-containing protein [Sulfitobacter mediterraneus]MBM1568438.1 UvrD-helicase domain-containing protein [Sulfitobacter mediterraneus]MBM1571959.1 UvrD-helicase domain-containing protein [Sulfitobacter mediterraneus]MBM1575748.1 UvrD-helicase domain-containing protein [Sulfitobacter mediterraneus]MBM1580070.1 UvrD-helicase domain-containing protein [Sulfitobacter mediterraneus]